MTIEALVRLVPPPAEPADARGDWRLVEATLGLGLPADFKALIERYGAGHFVDFVAPLMPFGAHAGLVPEAQRLLEDEAPFRLERPDESPYPFYPEPGGLLPWAATDNADRLCWLTVGAPQDWRVVAWNPRNVDYDLHPVGAVEFLHGWLTGAISTPVFPDAESPQPWFEPWHDLRQVSVTLTDSDLPYAARLQILRATLAPTVDRGAYDDGRGSRQEHFAATDQNWRLTYETYSHTHQIRISFPPDDEDLARTELLKAVQRMGCRIRSARTNEGQLAWA